MFPVLTLRQKIGQLLMAGFDGTHVNDATAQLIREFTPGGFILFRRNITSPQQIADLNRRLQKINAEVSDIPLLLAIDQEGGVVARIEEGITPLPSAMAFQASSTEDCATLTLAANRELRILGFNVNFAPVLDVNNNHRNPVIGVRAFGEDVPTVCKYGLTVQKAIQQAGIAATAKHFPGHGDTDTDSHTGLPRVGHDRSRLEAIELAPFRAAIAAGLDAIMSAHVVFPAFESDPDTPSTLSRAVMTDLLRGELGFDGVVFTDCLEMAAIAKGIGVVEGAVRAFKAGADVLLVSHQSTLQLAVIEALLQQVAQGLISEERIDASLTRILALKHKYAMQQWPDLPAMVGSHVAQKEDLQRSQRLHRQAVYWRGQPYTLDAHLATLVITLEVRQHTEIDVIATGHDTLGACLAARGLPVNELRLPWVPTAEDVALCSEKSHAFAQVICVSYNATLQPSQQAVLASLPAARTWLVAGRLPYDLDLMPAARARLGAYSNRPAALEALADALLHQQV